MNKEQLEALTGGELSLAIIKLKHGPLAENYRISPINQKARCLIGTDGCGSLSVSFDINDWSDMGPLIHENMISMKWHSHIYGGMAMCVGFCESGRHEVVHKNPLRAAAIVWLLMQEK